MMRRGGLGLWLAPLLLAQTQTTFYAAYQDGLDAERQGNWKAAAASFRRAIELRPASAPRIIIYGNNLLKDYAPHTHLARCLLETGDTEGASSALTQAARYGEPKAEQAALAQALGGRMALTKGPREAPEPPVAEVLTPKPPPPKPLPSPPPASPVESPSPPRQAPENPNPATLPTRLEPPRQQVPKTVAPEPPRPAPPSPSPSPTSQPRPFSWPAWPLFLLAALGGMGLLRRYLRRRSVDTSFREPEQLGPYRIDRLLGRGGFASTYLAHHATTRHPVALKLLHPYRHDDPEFLRRFRQEARLGAMLDHPNLVRLLDPGPESGTPWLAMEYIPGQRLDQKLLAEGPPALPEFRRIALQIAGAMAHAHSRGIVHRDLKPGNVILDHDQAKVMDFGISRIVDSTTLTTTYAFLGTPKYAAPEAQLKAQVGPAADRYAFGIMLFEMLAGHPPFDGETPFEILEKHQKEPLPDLGTLRPDLPPRLVDLIERLCRKIPEERPSDEELISTLERVLPAPPGKD